MRRLTWENYGNALRLAKPLFVFAGNVAGYADRDSLLPDHRHQPDKFFFVYVVEHQQVK